MTTKPLATAPSAPALRLQDAFASLRLSPPVRSRNNSSDSFDSDFGLSPTGSTSAATSQASSRRPSLSRHASLAASPKLSPHALENILDLAQTKNAADTALLRAALPSPSAARGGPLTASPSSRPTAVTRTHTAPPVGLSQGSGAWYTDAANPIIDGMQLRQTVASKTSPVQPHISQVPGGVQLIHMVQSRTISPMVASDLMVRGQSRYAARLKPDVQSNRLLKVGNKGRAHPAQDGFYACVIDQNDTLLVSLSSAESQGAPAGAHAHLAGGLPVRFAGELQIREGRVIWFNNASGHYRTPPYLVGQALTQPLLVDARIDLIGG